MIRPVQLATLTVLVALTGCVEKRILSVKGGLQGLPGAQGGYEISPDAPRPAKSSVEDVLVRADQAAGRSAPGEEIEGRPLRRRMPDGSILLVARSPRHVMIHLFETLRDGEDDLLLNQVVSRRMRDQYERRGENPRQIVKQLHKQKHEVVKMMASMPLADQTPGALMRTVGRNEFEITAPGGDALDQKFKRFSVVIEQGMFRLLSIG